jgi:cobalt-zinc-cadmium efflux system protein
MHTHGPTPGRSPAAESRTLRWVLAITAGFMLAEVIGGLISGSLALLADAGHRLTDGAALALSLAALRWARRPATPGRTYGWVRMEILAALVNGATLLVIVAWVVWEAVGRLRNPASVVDAPIMVGVAVVGLLVNAVGLRLLHGHHHGSLNARGAYLHVLGDLLGSVGAVGAGLVVMFTGWQAADPLASIIIAFLILVSAARLVREATDILLEAVPAHVDAEDLLAELREIEGLDDVHDLHIWTLTSGFVALTGHGILDDPALHSEILDAIRAACASRGITHVTFQLEPRPLYGIRPAPRVSARDR